MRKYRRLKSLNRIFINRFALNLVISTIVIVGLTIGFAYTQVLLISTTTLTDEMTEFTADYRNGEISDSVLDKIDAVGGWVEVYNEQDELLKVYLPDNQLDVDIPSGAKYETSITIENQDYRFVMNANPENFRGLQDQEVAQSFTMHFWVFLVILLGTLIGLIILSSRLSARKLKRSLKSLSQSIASLKDQRENVNIDSGGIVEFNEINVILNELVDEIKEKEELNLQLKQKETEMFSSLSHDIKTPIATIQGYSKALLDGYIDEGQKEETLKLIYDKSILVNQLINELHDYSKMEHRDYVINLEEGDICELCREVAIEYISIFEERGIRFHHQIDQSIMTTFNGFHLGRVLRNLFDNIIKHGLDVKNVNFSIAKVNDQVEIIVEDDGKEMVETIKANLFHPFEMGDASRGNGGSGLGLAIAKRIVNIHGGDLKLIEESHYYTTRFKITLK